MRRLSVEASQVSPNSPSVRDACAAALRASYSAPQRGRQPFRNGNRRSPLERSPPFCFLQKAFWKLLALVCRGFLSVRPLLERFPIRVVLGRELPAAVVE